MEKHTVITISRQYGSGGREVSEILSEKMGISCYDVQVLARAAEELGENDPESIKMEAYRTPEGQVSTLGERGFTNTSYYSRMFRRQAAIVKKIAEKESAIFFGRCADVVLKEMSNYYSFFIYADDDFRRERAKTHYKNLSLKDLDKEDRQRGEYYKHYTGEEWGKPENYDLMINTSYITLPTAADVIIDYIEKTQD